MNNFEESVAFGYQNFNRTEKVRINKFLLQETGTYNSMFLRPYNTFLNNNDLNNIVDRVEQFRTNKISGSLLSGITTNFVVPSATPGSEIPIPQGWNERRIRFILEVATMSNTGLETIYYFQGFTDYLGISNNGFIDPNMEFFINSFIRVNRRNQVTPIGNQLVDMVTESAQVLNNQIFYDNLHLANYKTLRPMDVFSGMQFEYIQNTHSEHFGGNIQDTRTNFSEPIRSNRINNIPSDYLAKIIDSHLIANNLIDFGTGQDDLLSHCRHNSYEASVNENEFIRMISNLRGYRGNISFTINELTKIDNNLSYVTKYIKLDPPQLALLHNAGQTSYWNSTNRETVAASILSNAIPSIMMELMISKIHFRSTNDSLNGVIMTTIINGLSITGIDLTRNYELFKNRIELEVLKDITYNNQEVYLLEMICDLFGETKINISLGNGPMTPYAVPSFSDSLLTPILTNDQVSYTNMINDVGLLMNNITSNNINSNTSSVNLSI